MYYLLLFSCVQNAVQKLNISFNITVCLCLSVHLHICLSFHLSAWNNLTPTGCVFMILCVGNCYWNLSGKFKFVYNQTKMTVNIHEDPHTSMTTLVSSITVAAFVINVTNVLWLLCYHGCYGCWCWQCCFNFVGYKACTYSCVCLSCHYNKGCLSCHYNKGYQHSLVAALMWTHQKYFYLWIFPFFLFIWLKRVEGMFWFSDCVSDVSILE